MSGHAAFGSPATGSHAIHAQEQNMILAAAFAPLPPKDNGHEWH